MTHIRNLFLLLLLSALALPNTADAQLLKRLKERAQDRIEDRAERKAEQAVDKAVDEAAESVEDAAASAFERRTRAKELNLGANAEGPANAAQVRYVSTTSMNLGAIGRIGRLFGRDLENTTETVAISGNRQRTDSGNESTIIDLDGFRMITIDHEKKQYWEMSFQAMMERMDAALAEMKDQKVAAEQQAGDQPEVKGDVKFDFSLDKTGRTDIVNGTPSEQVILTVRADFELEGENEEGQQEQVRGTTYAVMDTWNSKQLAGIETIQAFSLRMGEKMGDTMQKTEIGPSLAAMGLDPRTSDVMDKAAEEMQKFDGMTVRSTMHLVLVPEGQALDVDAVLNPANAGGGRMAQLAAAAEANEGEGPGQQMTLLSITTQLSDLQVDPLPADYFDVPAGYKQVDLF